MGITISLKLTEILHVVMIFFYPFENWLYIFFQLSGVSSVPSSLQ